MPPCSIMPASYLDRIYRHDAAAAHTGLEDASARRQQVMDLAALARYFTAELPISCHEPRSGARACFLQLLRQRPGELR